MRSLTILCLLICLASIVVISLGEEAPEAKVTKTAVYTFTIPSESIYLNAQLESYLAELKKSKASEEVKAIIKDSGIIHWWDSVGGNIHFLEQLEAKGIITRTGKKRDKQSMEVIEYLMDLRKAYQYKKEICNQFKMVGDDAATNILYGLVKTAIMFNNDKEIIRFFIYLPGPDAAGATNRQYILSQIKDAIPITFLHVLFEQPKEIQEDTITALFDVPIEDCKESAQISSDMSFSKADLALVQRYNVLVDEIHNELVTDIPSGLPKEKPEQFPRIAYTSNGWLYTVEIESTGDLRKGSQPQKICHLPGGEVFGSLAYSADGKYIAFSIFHKGDLYPFTSASLWVVEAQPGATPYEISLGIEPSFAPAGHLLAYTYNQTVCIFDIDASSFIDANSFRALRENSCNPNWTADGKEIALIEESKSKDFVDIVMVVDAETGQHVLFRKEVFNIGSAPLPSPDGRYIAFSPHLSRPKLKGIIVNRETKKEFALPYKGEPVLDWSSDSKWLLWTRWIIDPENDGAYLWLEVWITSFDGKYSNKIGNGHSALFTPDGMYVVYLHGRGKRGEKPTDLYISDMQGKKKKLLIGNVEIFAVQRKHR